MRKPFQIAITILAMVSLTGCANGISVVKTIDTTPPPKIAVRMFANCDNGPQCGNSGLRTTMKYAAVFDGLLTMPEGKSDTSYFGLRAPKETLEIAKSAGYAFIVEGEVTHIIDDVLGAKRLGVRTQVTDTSDGSIRATQQYIDGASAFSSIESMATGLAKDLKGKLIAP